MTDLEKKMGSIEEGSEFNKLLHITNSFHPDLEINFLVYVCQKGMDAFRKEHKNIAYCCAALPGVYCPHSSKEQIGVRSPDPRYSGLFNYSIFCKCKRS